MPSSIEDILGVDTWKLCSTWKDVLATRGEKAMKGIDTIDPVY